MSPSDAITLAVEIALAVFCAVYVALTLLRGGNRRTEAEQAADDQEQASAVSRPAPLRKHVKAGTAWGEPL